MKLAEMTWVEAVKKVAGKPVLVPHGSLEEHGHHLPLKTDQATAEAVCSRFDKSNGVVVAPTMNYTAIVSTRVFPGSVGANPPEYKEWLKSVVECFLKLNPSKVVFFLGHDGRTQKAVFAELEAEFPKLSHVSVSALDKEAVGKITETPGHAGEGETSLMLFIDPKSVKMGKAVDELWPEGGVSKSGVNGYPSKATKAKGKKLLDYLVKATKRALK
jgi:creatinine amidohydrolase